jgi:hypothetical protein
MSLDVSLMVTKPVAVYDANITHNLGAMARECVVGPNHLTLYDVLWRPDENELMYASEIIEFLDEGYNNLLCHSEHYKTFNPENGWGNYEGLLNFVLKYKEACMEDPDALLKVSR